MKISASIYSNMTMSLTDKVQKLDRFHVDFFHIDSIDKWDVFEDIKVIKSISKTPVDFHLISSNPEPYLLEADKLKVDFFCVQYENLPAGFEFPKMKNTKLGLAILVGTDINVFEKYKDVVEFVLIMTTTPGVSGGKFGQAALDQIRNFRAKYPSIKIHVDGGVDNLVSVELRKLSVYCSVSGSYLLNNPFFGQALLQLRTDIDLSKWSLKDMMILPEQLPLVTVDEADFKNVLHQIDLFNLGYCLIVDEGMILKGVVTNADVRRALIKSLDLKIPLEQVEFINQNPISITDNISLSDAMDIIQKANKPILFLPVIDQNKKLCGSISADRLIRG